MTDGNASGGSAARSRRRVARFLAVGGAVALAAGAIPAGLAMSAGQRAPTLHLRSTTGGEQKWVPAIDGFKSAPLPPPGFDPLTASNSELERYGYPPRPRAHGPQPRSWLRMVEAKRVPVLFGTPERRSTRLQERAAHTAASSPRAAASPGECDSSNWAGLVTPSSGTSCANLFDDSGPEFTEADGEFMVPGVASDNQATFSSDWVGIGSGDSMADPLIQAGMNADWSVFAHPSYGYWVQAPPSANLQMPVSLGSIGAPTPGNIVDVQVQYENRSTALYEIAYETVSNGNWYEGAWRYGFGQDTLGRSSTAEWIVEDTCIWPGNLWAFSQFGVVPFDDLDATYKGSWDPLSKFSGSLYEYTMLDKASAPVAKTNYPVSGWEFDVVNTKGTVNAPMGSCSM